MRAGALAVLLGLTALVRPGVAHADAASEQAARDQLVRDCAAYAEDYESSRSPLLLATLGWCGVKLERDGDALDAYERYLLEVPTVELEQREQLARHVRDLEVRVAQLTLHVGGPGVRILDARVPARGERIVNEYGPTGDDGTLVLRVRPGHHIVTARRAGFEDERWELDVPDASRAEHVFRLKPVTVVLPPPPHPGRGAVYGPWLVAGLGGAMLVAGTVTGVLALDRESRVESRCPNGACPPSFDLSGERSAGKTLAGATDVLLIGGGLAVLGGAAWYVFGTGRKAAPRRAPNASWTGSGTCGPTGCTAGVRGSF